MKENSFTQACYEQNSLGELRDALRGKPDSTDMATWGLTAQEWRECILDALQEKEKEDEAAAAYIDKQISQEEAWAEEQAEMLRLEIPGEV